MTTQKIWYDFVIVTTDFIIT